MFTISDATNLVLNVAAVPAQVDDEYFVKVTATGVPSGAYPPMMIKVTVVDGTPKGTVFIFR
jgi:hypothetical protein